MNDISFGVAHLYFLYKEQHPKGTKIGFLKWIKTRK